MHCFDWLTRFRYVLGAGVRPLLGPYSAMASLLITKLTMKSHTKIHRMQIWWTAVILSATGKHNFLI